MNGTETEYRTRRTPTPMKDQINMYSGQSVPRVSDKESNSERWKVDRQGVKIHPKPRNDRESSSKNNG